MRRGLLVTVAAPLQGSTVALAQRRGASQGSVGSSVPTSAPSKAGFRTSVKFKLSASEVNETNVPSAREVSQLLPSVKDLRAQLPSARELEKTYIRQEEATKEAAPNATDAPGGKEHIFVKTTDPFEDLLDAKEEGKTPADPRHVLLAYRALAWGTVYAVVGVTLVVVLCMWACGYHSLGALLQGVRDKVKREEARLRDKAERAAQQEGGQVVHYTIDLANPTEAYQQMKAIWQSVQDMAEDETTATDSNKG